MFAPSGDSHDLELPGKFELDDLSFCQKASSRSPGKFFEVRDKTGKVRKNESRKNLIRLMKLALVS